MLGWRLGVVICDFLDPQIRATVLGVSILVFWCLHSPLQGNYHLGLQSQGRGKKPHEL